MASREEKYIRRMRALGYEPTLAGMDDDDIEWELARMDRGRQEAQTKAAPLNPTYRPVDPGLEARILRQMGQPYNPQAISSKQSFYLNGWDDGEDEETAPAGPLVSRGVARPDEPVDPWANTWKLNWGEEGGPAQGARTMEPRWGQDGTDFLSQGMMKNALGYSPRGADAAAGVQEMSNNNAGSSEGINWLIDPFGNYPQYDGGTSSSGNATGTLDRYRSNEIVPGARHSDQEGSLTPGNMVPSDKAPALIETHEGLRLKPYRATPNDPLTIGIGHVILPGEDFSAGITEQQARAIFKKDIEKNAAIVNSWARENNVKLSQPQFDALVSFVFNMGSIGVEEKTQIIADTIKRGNATPEEIRNAFGLYVNGEDGPLSGLVTRRRDEADLFLNGDYGKKE